MKCPRCGKEVKRLLALSRADVRIIADELGDEDYVYSDTKPEPTYE